jgi:hypothetical protein
MSPAAEWHPHKIKITCPEGKGILTKVEMDGQEIRGLTDISFHVSTNEWAQVTMTLDADIYFEGESNIQLISR